MNLATLVLSALLALHHGKPTDADETRYREIAGVIAEQAKKAPLWTGEAGEIATAAALVAIGHHESGFLESVRRCRLKGDDGRSIGMFQLMRGRSWRGHKESEICESDELQTALALAQLHRARGQCPECVPAFWVRAYASGNGGLDTPAARAIVASWEKVARKMGVQVFPFAAFSPRPIEQAEAEKDAKRRRRASVARAAIAITS